MLVSLGYGGALKVCYMQGSHSCSAIPPASPGDSLDIIVAHPDGRHVLVGGTRLQRPGSRRQPLLCVLDPQTQR